MRRGSPSDLSSLFPPGKRRSKLKAADHALFGAMWWPYATLERLRIATHLTIWVSTVRRAQLPSSNFGSRSSSSGTTVCCAITLFGSVCRCLSLRKCTETDSVEFSELAMNLEDAQAFRATTLDRIRNYLALDHKAPDQNINTAQTALRRSILEQFAPVGRAILQHCTLGKYLLFICGHWPIIMLFQQSSAEL